MKKPGESKQSEIRKKIAQSGIAKPEDYEEIISNLIGQRERLETDLKVLREKVVSLQEKQARKMGRTTMGKRPSPMRRQQQPNLREELNRKYEQLKHWQKKSLKAMNNSALQVQYRTYLDKLFSIEQQIQLAMRQLYDERTTNLKLKKALKLITKDDQINHNVQEGIERENGLLKKRIGSLKKIVDRQLTKEVDLHQHLIVMKEKQRDQEKRERENEREAEYERQREKERMREIERQRESRIRRESNQRSGIRHRTQTTPSKQTQPSLDDEQIQSFYMQPTHITTKQEIYQIQGHLNRVENKFKADLAILQNNMKKNYPNEALQQKREGSKLTFGKEFELIFDKTKSYLNAYSELNKHKIKVLFDYLKDKVPDYEDSLRSSGTSLLKGLQTRPDDGFAKNFKTETRQTKGFKLSPAKKLKQRSNSETNIVKKEKYATVKVWEQTQMQTDPEQYADSSPLRKQFVGIIDSNRFNDRNHLRSSKFSSIKTLHIYYSQRGIATITATYNLHQTGRILDTSPVIPEHFLKNFCKIYTIDTAHDDFIRYFKVRYSLVENRIVNIKIVTHKNTKNGFGDSKIKPEEVEKEEKGEDEQKEYVFDIGRDEYAVSIFGSHQQKGPYWYLCAFGVEINDL